LYALELNYSRYKIIAQVLIGEQRGEGVRMATRCLWDAEADNYATQTFMSVCMTHCVHSKLILLR
jgi:hypothetical protein